MIHEAREEGLIFGIPVVIDGKVQDIFTETRILQVDRTYEGGESDILTQGERRGRIIHYDQQAAGKLYPGGTIDWLETNLEGDQAIQQQIFDFLEEMNNALGISKSFENSEEDITSFRLGHHIGLTKEQEYQLLSLNEEKARLQYILDHLQQILPVLQKKKPKAKLNGHYDNLQPPDY